MANARAVLQTTTIGHRSSCSPADVIDRGAHVEGEVAFGMNIYNPSSFNFDHATFFKTVAFLDVDFNLRESVVEVEGTCIPLVSSRAASV